MNCDLNNWRAAILFNNQKTRFRLHTVTQCNVISKEKFNQISAKPIAPSHARLMSFEGNHLTPWGKATICCRHNDK